MKTRRWAAVACAVLGLWSSGFQTAYGQETSSDDYVEDELFPIMGMRFGPPQPAAIYAGVLWQSNAALREACGPEGELDAQDPDCYAAWTAYMHVISGTSIVAEMGLGGGQISVGLGGIGPPLTMRLEASLLRTWGAPWKVEPEQTFVGAEFRTTVILLGFGVGMFWRVAGDAPDDARFFQLSGIIGI